MSCFLGIDIGTSSVKTTLVNDQGIVLARAVHDSVTLQPLPGGAEQNADDWWRGSAFGIRSCLKESGADPRSIKGISVCGMVPNLCALDADGLEVRPAILYRDSRALDQISRLSERLDLEFTTQDVAPKLLWIKENEPGQYQRIAMVLNSHSYLVYRLTGQFSIDRDSASIFGQGYDLGTGWNEARIRRMGLDPSMLPPIYAPLDVVGYTHKDAAEAVGLVEGIPVIAGTGDSFTVLVGSGTVEKDAGVIYLGTAGTMLSLEYSLDDLIDSVPFLTGDARFLGNVLMGGAFVTWFSGKAMAGTRQIADLEAAAASVPAGADSLFFIPHLLGKRSPVPDDSATGHLLGLRDGHDWRHFYRAGLEGVAYALRESFDASGKQLSTLRLFGGGCKSAVWRSVLVNVFGMAADYSPTADNAVGTAFMAGLATGTFHSYREMNSRWIRDMETVPIDPDLKHFYDRGYIRYLELSEQAAKINRIIGEDRE